MKCVPNRVARAAMGLVLTWITTGAAEAQDLVADTEPLTPEREVAMFHLPPGFEAQLVASEPEIAKPLNLAFDDRGRLWVSSTVEYPFPPEDGRPGRDRVTILGGFEEDGRATSIVQFAEDLTIPIGILPTGPSSALVFSIPKVWSLEDTDGDGKADRRSVVLETFGRRDTHGMTNAFTIGFDGWVYACHGFSNTSEVSAEQGGPVVMQSGNTYRFLPDGSRIERWTHGQVNPFGLAFDPLGGLWSCDCHTMPIYHLLPGAYYPSFGKPDDGLGFGPKMMAHAHGSTGIAGIVVYEADHFPESYFGDVFVGNPVTARVNHDRIDWHGSTPEAIEQPDFLVSDDPWFRPVDLEVGPDGALYIADFYNRIIGHYEVPLTHPGRDRQRGRIWRIVYKGEGNEAPILAMPEAVDGDIGALADRLGRPNLGVRLRATTALAEWPAGAPVASALAPMLGPEAAPEAKSHALWALERRGELSADRLGAAMIDPGRAVRVHAMRITGEREGWSASLRSAARIGLLDPDPFVRRAAAEGIGRHPDPSQIRPLLEALDAVDPADTHLVHVLRMALRDQLVPSEAWAALPEPLSKADRHALADVSLGVPSAEASGFLLEVALGKEAEPAILPDLVARIAQYGTNEDRDAIRDWARDSNTDAPHRALGLLRAFQRGAQARGETLDDATLAWAEALARRFFESGRPEDRLPAIDLAGAFGLRTFDPELDAILGDPDAVEADRLAAIDAMVALDPSSAVAPLAALIVDSEQPAAIRERAATALGRTGRADARSALLEALALAPAALQRTIAVALSASKDGAEALLDAVEGGHAPARLLREAPVPILLNNAEIPAVNDRIEALTLGLPPANEALRALVDARLKSFGEAAIDPEAGRAVFENHCASCHRLGGGGAEVGPQLDGVGVRGPDRLMEDILNPNLNVDQAFRSTTLALNDGRVLAGLLLSEEGDVLVLADAEGKSQRIPVADVEDRAVAPLSPMPANFDQRIPEDEFRRLIAFLLAQRAEQGGE